MPAFFYSDIVIWLIPWSTCKLYASHKMQDLLKEKGHLEQGEVYILFVIRSGANFEHIFVATLH